MKGENRLSNFELLRCICIVYIILFHCIYKSDIDLNTFSINTFLIENIYLCGEMGVNIFILISGYFFDKTEFKWRKILDYWCIVQFYTVLSIAIKILVFHEGYRINGIKELVRLLLPFSFGRYWFLSAYILIYIFSPYIKCIVVNLSKNEFTKIIVFTVGIWCIWATVIGVINSDTINLTYYHRYFWLFIVYICGIYIKMYDISIMNYNKTKLLFVVIVSQIVNAIYIVIYNLYPEIMNKIGFCEATFFWRENSILCFGSSIFLFMYFSNLNIKYSKIINTVASTSFGVYLIHDGLLQNNIWGNLVHVNEYMDSWFCILYIIVSVILIYIACALIEYMRQIISNHIGRIVKRN